ncbi:iron-containing alcohol dehydrogenase [Noviherbaspirillum denitrificans]|uniref:Alcohol dehydrogenase n=1 Tax=Noviherbaspirillum denitrificans TaxID=1968433 RepID=A0A254TDU8_9BURK|nr:iron-containing alcohol dehydrogenase [Noviherbaspirillum denitrificans]OWW18713.1 alcohol dehydrogenase [Noviherbaspirillum denitrificans]
MDAGMHEFLAQDRVIWGKPATEAVLEEVGRREARRVFIVTGRTLNRQTDVVSRIRNALGTRYAGTFDECVEHTPRATVFAAARAINDASADLIVTVGGGTAIDTVKVVLIVLAHGLTSPDELDAYRVRPLGNGDTHFPPVKAPPLRQIVVSTTLSGAEFSNYGGCVDPVRGVKDGYAGREIGAASVILDPEITLHTPERLWLSTGIRAVDHAVESICSRQPSALVDATALHALSLFNRSLQRTREQPSDLAARLDCMQAAWLASFGILRVPFGASHGIGHSLGAVTGMGHGYTSCIMLPHVMRFNLGVTGAAQERIAAALGRQDGDAAAGVAALIESLALPQRLRDVGVERSQFEAIALGALNNIWVRSNPRPITSAGEIVTLLEGAW